MTANELRIGNYVLDSYNGKITRINWQEIKWIQEVTDRYASIELTEEILLKYGFEKKQSYINGVGLCVFFENKKFNYRLNEFFEVVLLKIKLKNLHQLQNLYFALTGEEL